MQYSSNDLMNIYQLGKCSNRTWNLIYCSKLIHCLEFEALIGGGVFVIVIYQMIFGGKITLKIEKMPTKQNVKSSRTTQGIIQFIN